MPGPLSGKTAIVTGGTRDIGGAISGALAAAGVAVAMLYLRREQDADAFTRDLASAKWRWRCVAADPVAQAAALIEILVANAGLTIAAPLSDCGEEHFDRMFAVNVRSPFLPARMPLA